MWTAIQTKWDNQFFLCLALADGGLLISSSWESMTIHLKLEIRSMERGICPIATLALHLTLYSLTGSRFDP